MTHCSQLPVSHDLDQVFSKARTDGGIRFIKVVIRDEQLVADGTQRLGNDLRSDFEKVSELLKPKSPCYVLFRLDSQNMTGYEWLLIAYVPDGSTVKDRMLYASTRDSMKKQLGKGYFVNSDLYGTEVSEFSWAFYQDTLKKPATSHDLLTPTEMQYHHEAVAEIDHGHTREYVHSVRFPLASAAENALAALATKHHNFVQLSVDTERETVELVSAKKVAASNLAKELSSSEPRFTFYRFTHTFKGESLDSIIFIYSCPDGAPVKQRMLYSTVKAVVTGAAEDARVIVEKNGKIEVNEPSDITEEYLVETLHPPVEVKKGFARPMRPGKGGARLIRGNK